MDLLKVSHIVPFAFFYDRGNKSLMITLLESYQNEADFNQEESFFSDLIHNELNQLNVKELLSIPS
eukprot:CAMPEP_0170565034 /NCGR_PEP_ID=MMETSP0211-20121228/76340_1 /TAXON_ID=311385 /ORGANISM="Pseudokeronopsis sp., Strain OXSARD2" /LENGTH=65 /DNA_ID=CAMNT_0010885281 /DNA_START=128 /DNA_END=322 /DNA_ORIENTATION=+